eukprot:9986269-Karenia_brevis.AAC.1
MLEMCQTPSGGPATQAPRQFASRPIGAGPSLTSPIGSIPQNVTPQEGSHVMNEDSMGKWLALPQSIAKNM